MAKSVRIYSIKYSGDIDDPNKNTTAQLLELKTSEGSTAIVPGIGPMYPQSQFILYHKCRVWPCKTTFMIGSKANPQSIIAVGKDDDAFHLMNREKDDYSKVHIEFTVAAAPNGPTSLIKVDGTDKLWGVHKDSSAVGIYKRGTPHVSFNFHIEEIQSKSSPI